ncbi:unnamed protein product [Caenorhabditis sp. 36 PRJEB53466]|nr:unnamed protein product [Caenorhabditis sp. 36 PRJEB53466]
MILLFLLSLSILRAVNCQCQRPDDKYIGDLCFFISNQKESFRDATDYCHGISSNLAVIHTSLQSNFLASLVRIQTGASVEVFWIGLSRASVGSRYQWDDGTAMYWSNFDANFPQDDLFVAESTINGKWRTLDGQKSLFFVCSYDPKHGTPGTVGPITYQAETTTTSSQSTVTYSSSSSYPTSSSSSTSSGPIPTDVVSTVSSSSPVLSTSDSSTVDYTTSSIGSTASQSTSGAPIATIGTTRSTTSGTMSA